MSTHYRGTPAEQRALDAFIKLMRATDSVSADLSRHVAAEGLTLGQFGVLEALLHRGALCQGELGTKLLRSGSNVTTVVDNLEKRGLVQRTRRADDRRVIDVSLTPQGRRLIRRIFPAHARRIVRLFGALSADNQQRLGELCRTLGRSVSQEIEHHE
jgi:MarR family 2-MHQ and catechol resistance regulon transcriptional repressor